MSGVATRLLFATTIFLLGFNLILLAFTRTNSISTLQSFVTLNSNELPQSFVDNSPLISNETSQYPSASANTLAPIVFAMVMFGATSAEEGSLALKSALMHASRPTDFHIVCSPDAMPVLQEKLDLFSRPAYDIRVKFYPLSEEMVKARADRAGVGSKHAAGVGGLVKVFLHDLLYDVDKVIFFDTDMLFLVDPYLLWREFDEMKHDEMVSFPTLGPQSGTEAVCTCVMLLNLQLMRSVKFMPSTLLPPSTDAFPTTSGATWVNQGVDPLNPDFGDQGLYWAIWKQFPERYKHLSLSWDMTHCRFSYGLSLADGNDNMPESEQISHQEDTRFAPERFPQLFPAIVHFNCQPLYSIVWDEPLNSNRPRWGPFVTIARQYKWVWLNRGNGNAKVTKEVVERARGKWWWDEIEGALGGKGGHRWTGHRGGKQRLECKMDDIDAPSALGWQESISEISAVESMLSAPPAALVITDETSGPSSHPVISGTPTTSDPTTLADATVIQEDLSVLMAVDAAEAVSTLLTGGSDLPLCKSSQATPLEQESFSHAVEKQVPDISRQFTPLSFQDASGAHSGDVRAAVAGDSSIQADLTGATEGDRCLTIGEQDGDTSIPKVEGNISTSRPDPTGIEDSQDVSILQIGADTSSMVDESGDETVIDGSVEKTVPSSADVELVLSGADASKGTETRTGEGSMTKEGPSGGVPRDTVGTVSESSSSAVEQRGEAECRAMNVDSNTVAPALVLAEPIHETSASKVGAEEMGGEDVAAEAPSKQGLEWVHVTPDSQGIDREEGSDDESEDSSDDEDVDDDGNEDEEDDDDDDGDEDEDEQESEGELEDPSEGIRDDLETALDGCSEFQGSFYFHKSYSDAPNPLLRVADLGTIGLPLSEREACVLRTRCIQAPFGKGERTIVDMSVRDTWEIDSTQISFGNPSWTRFVDGVVKEVCTTLGVNFAASKPRCELYKLLLYETGSHFLAHQDTEKTNGMFATTVIVLPSHFTGGAAHLSHAGLSRIVDTSENSLAQTTVLSWYTDVTHEIKPITSGFRLALSYNLIHTTNALRPALSSAQGYVESLRHILLSWRKAAKYTGDCPVKLFCLLDHQYTQANLRGSALKGIDAHKMALLVLLAKELGFHLGLASVEHHCTGDADEECGYGYRRDNVTMGEIESRVLTITHLTDLDGNLLRKDVSFDEESEAIPAEFQEAVEDGDYDKEEYEGYMGNYAGSVERWYRRTVLVIWPDSNNYRIVYSGGNYALALGQLRASTSLTPTRFEKELFEYVLDAASQVKHSPESVLEIACEAACKWGSLRLWLQAVKECSGTKSFSMLTHDRIFKAVEKFGFGAVKPVIEDVLSKETNNMARYDFLKSFARHFGHAQYYPHIAPWLVEYQRQITLTLAKPTTEEYQFLVEIAMNSGGLGALKEIILPQVLAKADTSFVLEWAAHIRHQRGNLAQADSELRIVKQIVVELLSSSILKTDFFAPVPAKVPYPGYQGRQPDPVVGPQVALTFIKACLATDNSGLIGAIVKKLTSRPTGAKSERLQQLASSLLLPLIGQLNCAPLQQEVAFIPDLSNLCQTSIAWFLLDRKASLSKQEFTLILTTVILGGDLTSFPGLVIPKLRSLPCDGQALKEFALEVQTRRDQLCLPGGSKDSIASIVTELVTLVIKKQRTTSSHDIIDLLQLCLVTGNAPLYSTIIQRAIDTSLLAARYVKDVLVPLLPALRGFLNKNGLSPTQEPFASAFKRTMFAWLKHYLGRKPDDKGVSQAIENVKKLPCSCDPCKRVVKFLTSHPDRILNLERIGCPKRKHVETYLSGYCHLVATWDMIRTSPQGLTVTKTDFIFKPAKWRADRHQAQGILKSISADDGELRLIFGLEYVELIQRLNGQPTDTPLAARSNASGAPSSSKPSDTPSFSSSRQLAHAIVNGVDRQHSCWHELIDESANHCSPSSPSTHQPTKSAVQFSLDVSRFKFMDDLRAHSLPKGLESFIHAPTMETMLSASASQLGTPTFAPSPECTSAEPHDVEVATAGESMTSGPVDLPNVSLHHSLALSVDRQAPVNPAEPDVPECPHRSAVFLSDEGQEKTTLERVAFSQGRRLVAIQPDDEDSQFVLQHEADSEAADRTTTSLPAHGPELEVGMVDKADHENVDADETRELDGSSMKGQLDTNFSGIANLGQCPSVPEACEEEAKVLMAEEPPETTVTDPVDGSDIQCSDEIAHEEESDEVEDDGSSASDEDMEIVDPSENIRGDLEKALEGSLGFKGAYSFDRVYEEAPNPYLRLADLGNIGLPLSEREAQVIKTRCFQAPFGKGERTVVDTSVRDTWEMNATQVSFDNPEWTTFINGVVQDVCSTLGVNFAVSRPRCELYKLLLYETGSHFLAHKDTEKANGMFATIIIVLPSRFLGGAAHLSHGGLSRVVDCSSNSMFQTTVLSWYTDVTHEIKPITSGYRLALSYNLIHTTNALRPVLPSTHDSIERLRHILRSWKKAAKARSDKCPAKLMCLLEHEYSQVDLGGSALKGIDAHKMGLLDLLAKELGFCLGLASVECHLTGYAQDNGGYDSEGDDEVSMAEVQEREMSITCLTDLDGNLLRDDVDYDAEEEMIPADLEETVESGGHDEQEYEGYMGNGAGSLERWYRRTVLVIWPNINDFEILYSGGNFPLALKQLRNNISTAPTRTDLQLFEYLFRATEKGNHPKADVLRELCCAAYEWRRVDLWVRAVQGCSGDKSFSLLTVGEIFRATEIFGFEAVRPVIEETLKNDSSNTARYGFLNEFHHWCSNQPSNGYHLAWLEAQHDSVTRSLAAPTADEMQLLLDVAKKYGGLLSLKDTILPQVQAKASPGFLLRWSAYIHNARAAIVGNHSDNEILHQIVMDLISPSISKADFLAPVQVKAPPQQYGFPFYGRQPVPSPNPDIAHSYIRVCLSTDNAPLVSRVIQKLTDGPADFTLEDKAKRASSVLLPLIDLLAKEPDLTQIKSIADMGVLCQTSINWFLLDRKIAPSKQDLSSMLTAIILGGDPTLFASVVVPKLKALPCSEQILGEFVQELQARRDEINLPLDGSVSIPAIITDMVSVIISRSRISSSQSVIDLLQLCFTTGNAPLYSVVLQMAFDPSAFTQQHITQVLVPLPPALRAFISKSGLSPTQEPFASAFRRIMFAWLKQFLGLKPDEQGAAKTLEGIKKLPCSCDPCQRVVKFLTLQPDRTLRLERIGAPKRKHVETHLSRYCRLAATWDTIRSTPQGLTVTKTDLIFKPVSWRASRQQAQGILKTISEDDRELRLIFGLEYTELVQRLSGQPLTPHPLTSSSLEGPLGRTFVRTSASASNVVSQNASSSRLVQTRPTRDPPAASTSASTAATQSPVLPASLSSTTQTPKKRKDFHPDSIIDLCTP
ncbi:glycosyltransferase family 8 protein [Jaapia argillacea MUCL 33604]|uniref:Glycosyltransferase family 8 protein n=1 Tax=Jaapia argillacea MUCL 33604 TaxID=933084 RepID=A0A067Q2C5_9AGAM|nr:glycosyltransferase family 8 protein [Jaapia argillacea MUCL 33604]